MDFLTSREHDKTESRKEIKKLILEKKRMFSKLTRKVVLQL